MPRKAKSSTQCVYVENGRRCMRSGAGDPPICRAHQIAFEQASQPLGRGEAVFNVLESWLTGKRPSKRDIRAAVHEVHGFAHEYRQNHPSSGPASPGPGPRPQPRAAPPPRPDPMAEAKRRFGQAKVVLGFAESEPITADDVKRRRVELAKRYHPDRAGRDETERKRLEEHMIRVNAAADELLQSAA